MNGAGKVAPSLFLPMSTRPSPTLPANLKIVSVPIAELRPAEYNPRSHTDAQKEQLMESIRKYGPVDPIIHKRPGGVRYGNLVLKRELVSEDDLRAWYKKVLAGTTDRKSGSVIYLDRAGQEVLRYNFFEAWPCRWKAPELASGGNLATEEIDLCVDRIERVDK